MQDNNVGLDGYLKTKSAYFSISVSVSSAIAITCGPLAFISPMFARTLLYVWSFVAIVTTGVSFVSRANGPCLSSPAANPSA